MPRTHGLPGIRLINNPDMGTLPLPLKGDQVTEVSKVCSLAPFGKKDKTIYDTSVRNTWQLEPSQFAFANPKWEDAVQKLIPHIKADLGIPGVSETIRDFFCEPQKIAKNRKTAIFCCLLRFLFFFN